MQPLFWIALAAMAAGLSIHLLSTWLKPGLQSYISLLSMPFLAVAAYLVINVNANLIAVLFALTTYILIVNGTRLIQRRMHELYLRRTVRRSALLLAAIYVIIFILWYLLLSQRIALDTARALSIITGLSLGAAIVLLCTSTWRLIRNRAYTAVEHIADKDLPSVTIAIPARNETLALTDTLQAVLASDYPKLEVLVLDDCSQDKTAEIIRGFAQDGVRFVEGKPLPDDGHWLSKNFAYEQLARTAAGEYVLFSSVDVNFEPNSIRKIVTLAVAKKQTMVSVLPSRRDMNLLSFAIQPLRAWWQIALPKEWFGRPPAMSSAWLVNRKSLLEAGSFAAVSRSATPESYFARLFHLQKAHLFVLAGNQLGVASKKSLADQYRTALRLRYPEAHRRPEQVLGWLLFEALVLGAPFVAIAVALIQGHTTVLWLAVSAAICLTVSYAVATLATQPKVAWLALLTFPLSLLAEILLLNWSMLEYEFGSIEWKGRNVCLPVMHVIPHLPKLEE